MTIKKPPYSLSAASAKAILDAARPAAPPSPETIEKVRRWLETRIKRAMKRAQAERIVRADVTKLENAYRRFQSAIRGLQDRDDPPPKIPISAEGETAWDEWIDGFRVIPFERGAGESRDWQLVGDLLALYEVTSKKSAAATLNGPTLRFLDNAFGKLALIAPAKKPLYFTCPKPDAFRHKLPRLKRIEIPSSHKTLAMFLA